MIEESDIIHLGHPEDSPVEGNEISADFVLEKNLRPTLLSEYVGQKKVKENLSLFMQAACGRGDSLDHVLLAGPPGLGKTTLAHIIAQEMGAQIHCVTGPNVEKKGRS